MAAITGFNTVTVDVVRGFVILEQESWEFGKPVTIELPYHVFINELVPLVKQEAEIDAMEADNE